MHNIFSLIVTYNGMYWIKRCLDRLVSSSISTNIVIVDNNSTDGTIEFIKKKYPFVKLITNNSNLGFGKANNIGIRYAIKRNADYILFLNQDVMIENTTISKMLNLSHQKMGLITPIHLDIKGKTDKNFSKNLTKNFNSYGLLKVQFVNAAIWFMPIDIIKKIGGFDPLFPHYGEDRDYCNRLNYYGYDIYISNSFSIKHERKYSKKNIYRSKTNLLYTTGLSFIKNINDSLIIAYIKWILYRLKPIMKNLFFLRINLVIIDLYVILRLIIKVVIINKSRKISKIGASSYL